jgi:hypothetical protein
MNTTIESRETPKHAALQVNAARSTPQHNGAPALSPERILQLGTGFLAAKTVLSAAELGLFTELAKGPVDAETLRTRLGLHSRAALDFFDTLVALKLLERHAGKYSNSPEADIFLDRSKPGYIGGLLEMCSVRLFGHWNHLTEALRTGSPQSEVKGNTNSFDALYSTPEKLEGFLQSMTGISLGAAKALAAKFSWQEYRTFADVGAAQGAVPVQVALANPHLKGMGYDLPAVKPIFEKYIAAASVADRVRFQPGDFFKDPLPAVDVIIMGRVLHDWDLEQKKLLLRKAFNVLPEGGACIVYEALIDDARREHAFGLLMSLNMLIETPGGFDFTGADCRGWMQEAGFQQIRVEHLAGPDSMVVGIK